MGDFVSVLWKALTCFFFFDIFRIMKISKEKGFTLIELLVVVLIIGILSAIALPQYTKAVEKSKLSEALLMMRNLEKGMDLYILNNGYPSESVSFTGENATPLDIDVKDTKNWWVSASCGSSSCSLFLNRAYERGSFPKYHIGRSRSKGSNNWTGQCQYYGKYEFLCKQLQIDGWVDTLVDL